MVHDLWKNIQRYRALSPALAVAVSWLDSFLQENPDPSPCARQDVSPDFYYSIQQYDTRPSQGGLLEAHNLYLDIHLLLSGTEEIYIAERSLLREAVCYDPSKDAAFYEGGWQSCSRLEPGSFLICFPHDAHLPGTAQTAGPVKKLMAKVRL